MKFDVAYAARQRKHWCAPAQVRPRRLAAAGPLLLLALAGLLSGCASSDQTASSSGDTRLSRPTRKFTDASYGNRVVALGAPVPKGGGTYKIGSPYQMGGKWYVPRAEPGYDARGMASWYGEDFHGRKTANGEIYDMHGLTAAHPTLPLPSYAWVTNETNGRTILVRINDRGPYARDRIIDLSRTAARELGYENNGTAHVRVRYAGPAPLDGNDARERRALAEDPWRRGGPRLAEAAPSPAPRQTSYAPAREQAPPPYRTEAAPPAAVAPPAQRVAYTEPARGYPARAMTQPVAQPSQASYAGRDDWAAMKAQGRLSPEPAAIEPPRRAPVRPDTDPVAATAQGETPAEPASGWSVSGYRQSIAGQRRSLGGP